MISIGITGTARHGMKPKSASSSLVKTLALRRAAARPDRLARPRHVRRVDVVADHLQREIGLHARADVEGAVMEQRPAAMRALNAAQIDRDLALRVRRRPARQDSAAAARIRSGWWRRPRARSTNGRPGCWRVEQRLRRRGSMLDRAVQSPIASVVIRVRSARSSTSSAARLPDRTALSNVAGNPVAVQSPARNEVVPMRPRRRTPGVSSGRGREGRPPLADDLPRRQFGCNSASPATPPARWSEPARPRHVHQAVGIADRDRQPAGEGKNPFGGGVDDAEHRRHARRHLDAEMGVGDGAIACGTWRSGTSAAAAWWRHRQNDRVARRRA